MFDILVFSHEIWVALSLKDMYHEVSVKWLIIINTVLEISSISLSKILSTEFNAFYVFGFVRCLWIYCFQTLMHGSESMQENTQRSIYSLVEKTWFVMNYM